MPSSKTTVIDPDGGGDVTSGGGAGGNRGTGHSLSTSPVPTVSSTTSSPFVIGKAFMKQYYHMLTTSPEQILKFYKADTSSLSHSLEASTRAEPVILNAQDSPNSIFGWTMGVKVADLDQRPSQVPPGIRFDFEHGAIDAQETINGGILLVVTGLMYLPTSPETPKAFAHTFVLLNGSPPGMKKHFYVHNDILRVMAESPVTLSEDVDEATDKNVVTGDKTHVPSATISDNLDDIEQPIQENETAALSQDPAVVIHVKDTVVETSTELVNSASAIIDDAMERATDAIDAVKGGDDKRRRSKRGSRSRKSDASSPVDKSDTAEVEATPTSTTTPATAPVSSSSSRNGSSRGHSKTSSAVGNKPKSIETYASALLATTKSGSTGSSAKGQKSSHDNAVEEYKDGTEEEELGHGQEDIKPDSVVEKSAVPDIKAQAVQESSIATGTIVKSSSQRNPDATLYIKSVPEKTKESEIRAVFEPYAVQLKKNILGITIQPGRGFCFVDFDSKEVVDTVMSEVQKLTEEGKNKDGTTYKFSVNGHPLNVNRKVNENANRGRGHGGNFGGSGRGQMNLNPSNACSQKQNQADGSGGGTGGGGKQKNSPRSGGGNRGGGQRSTTTVGEN